MVTAKQDPYEIGDEQWNRDERHETPTERLDRNWGDLLQELRVVQTGVQLLTGFLLTLPFQQRFDDLATFDKGVYLFAVSCSVLAAGLLITPVMLHRLLFRRHARLVMVKGAHRLAMSGTGFLGVAVVSVTLLIFDFVANRTVGAVAASVVGLLPLGLWVLMPTAIRLGARQTSAPGTPS